MRENSRRRFLKNSLMSLAAVPLLRHTTATAERAVTITLEGRAEQLGNEIVSFGLPFRLVFCATRRRSELSTSVELSCLRLFVRSSRGAQADERVRSDRC